MGSASNMTEGTLDIEVNDVIIETDQNGTTMGHVIDISTNWITDHWLTGANTNLPGGLWACPIVEARRAIESGEWELLTDTERYNFETQ